MGGRTQQLDRVRGGLGCGADSTPSVLLLVVVREKGLVVIKGKADAVASALTAVQVGSTAAAAGLANPPC